MLDIIGLLLALGGAGIYGLYVFMVSRECNVDSSKTSVFISIGFTGFVYTLLIYILAIANKDYIPQDIRDWLVFSMGLVTMGVSIGRVFFVKKALCHLSDNKYFFSKMTIYLNNPETFMIYTLMMSVLAVQYFEQPEQADFISSASVIVPGILTMAAFAFIGGLVYGILMRSALSRSDEDGIPYPKDFKRHLLFISPGLAVGVIGVLLGLLIYAGAISI